jgi:hypothetical protein
MARTTTRSQFEATNYADVIRPVASPAALRDHIACLAESLRRKNAEALGFLPRRTYYDAIHRDRLVCTLENDEPCGILLWGRRRERVKIHQTVVAPDCRRLLHATHAVEAILEHDDAKTASVLHLHDTRQTLARSPDRSHADVDRQPTTTPTKNDRQTD